MEQLRVNRAALQAMAATWSNSAVELTTTPTPNGIGPSSQPSAAAVKAAHADVAVFTAALATQVDMRAGHVGTARTNYIAGEAQSADELAALDDSTFNV